MKRRALGCAALALPLAVALGTLAPAATAQLPRALDAVVGVAARVPADARTVAVLGRHRFGSGAVIDGAGLVLTVGYLILEADEVRVILADDSTVEADVVAYDNRTGFGLVRTREPLDVTPLRLAERLPEAPGTPMLVATYGGEEALAPGMLVERREFAGYWEYLLDDALFVSPAHARFAGASLVDTDGRLVGIGSLVSRDVADVGSGVPGMMFIPATLLPGVLPDLLLEGRSDSPPQPWLGLYLSDPGGLVTVARVATDSPAADAGLMPGDVIAGVDGEPVKGLAEFYRRVWSLGAAGVSVPLDLLRADGMEAVTIESADRYEWLRLRPTDNPG